MQVTWRGPIERCLMKAGRHLVLLICCICNRPNRSMSTAARSIPDAATLNPILGFFRCPEWFGDSELRIQVDGDLASGLDAIEVQDPFWRQLPDRSLSTAACARLIEMLRCEQYQQAASDTSLQARLARETYYFVRPLLGVALRRHLQRLSLFNWRSRRFPRWPVDHTVDELFEALLLAAMKLKQVNRVPFIWFWPDGYSSCALMTHDVETRAGLKFCPTLMDLDDAASIVSAFQLVPEQRYKVSMETVESIRGRGFEVNIHDLNHDGHLFRDRETFRRRAERINAYGERFGARGFRAGALYRNQDWFSYLKFSYEMSVPNVAHLDPQHGGCCTVFPYFVGDLVELPVTVTQDYSLFHVLRTYSMDLWRKQISDIVKHHGLVHVIIHPDYVMEPQARQMYASLLRYFGELRATENVWIARPGEVDTWWRQRANLRLVWSEDHWSITGQGHERASVAYAELVDGRLEYNFQHSTAAQHQDPMASASERHLRALHD